MVASLNCLSFTRLNPLRNPSLAGGLQGHSTCPTCMPLVWAQVVTRLVTENAPGKKIPEKIGMLANLGNSPFMDQNHREWILAKICK